MMASMTTYHRGEPHLHYSVSSLAGRNTGGYAGC